MILYHGWSDPTVTPLETVKYYEAVGLFTARSHASSAMSTHAGMASP
jgi:hypothetical protein